MYNLEKNLKTTTDTREAIVKGQEVISTFQNKDLSASVKNW